MGMNVSRHVAKLFLEGDEKAAAEVYKAYRALLYFIISSYLSNKEDCEDAFQETFLAVLSRISEIKSPEALHSYLCQTAKSKAIDIAKANAKIEGDYIEEDIISPKESNIDSLLPLDLSRGEKLVVGYRVVFGLSYKEISNLTGDPIVTLKARYSRAIKKAKGAL